MQREHVNLSYLSVISLMANDNPELLRINHIITALGDLG